jgi:hypothetical protein
MAEFFGREGQSEFGPPSADELRALAASGRLTAAGEVRKGRQGNWLPATNVQGLFNAVSENAERVESGESEHENGAIDAEPDEQPFAELASVAIPEPLALPGEAAPAGIDEAERYPGLRLVALYYKTASLVVGAGGVVTGFGIVIWSLSSGMRWPALVAPVLWGALSAIAGAILAIILWSIAELIRLFVDLELNTRRAASGIAAMMRGTR